MEKRVLKDHNLFKPKNLEEGRHEVVGDCNGFTMQQRWDAETPAFAEAILHFVHNEGKILDYGCGVGRLAKEILKQNKSVFVTGTDASGEMLREAKGYVNSKRFSKKFPQELNQKFDIAYLIYVLQHVPAIEIREILARIHSHLKANGFLIYCSSDYRMAIRYDGQGFFDDRILGVDLQAEVSRFFEQEGTLFNEFDFEKNLILKKMITGCDGGLAHPAFVYRKRKISGPLFNVPPPFSVKMLLDAKDKVEKAQKKEESDALPQKDKEKKKEVKTEVWMRSNPKKILLLNRLSPGDIMVMTNAIRDLHLAHPGKYLVDIRTPCNEIFDNSPYITKLQYDESQYNQVNHRFSQTAQDENNKLFVRINAGEKELVKEFLAQIGDILVIDMHYPLIHESGTVGYHFSQGHRDWLEQVLEIKIHQTDLRPNLFLTQDEKDWPSPALVKEGVDGPYWVINAGAKKDNTLKQYPYYQEVVDLLKDKITLVQIGQESHLHAAFSGVVDMRGKTNTRELFRLIAKAEGVITCVSFPMHIAAAFSKPCVVVAGAREGTRWELYPNHQFLYVNGCLTCAPYDGCWRGKEDDCNNKIKNVPRCMSLIRPVDVAWAVERYYKGGLLEYAGEVAHA
jgi:ADP-heptose:LPS heptosyltransferase/SAM-dependent methyltransferase